MMEESRRLQNHGLIGGPNVRAINVAISPLPSCCLEHGGQCPQQSELSMWLHEPCLCGVPNMVSNHCGSINVVLRVPNLVRIPCAT